jgi:hypothetical protein
MGTTGRRSQLRRFRVLARRTAGAVRAARVAWTWPLVLHLGDRGAGRPGDNYSFLWNLWWMRHVLATPGLPYFHTSHLFYPFGTTIADHPHCALPALVAATLLKPLSIITAYNLLLLRSCSRTWPRCTRWRGRSSSPRPTGGRRRASILAAVIFGLSPYVAAAPARAFRPGRRLGAAGVCAGAAPRGPRRLEPAAFAAGAVLVATAYTAYYYVVYLCLFTAAYLTAWAFHVSVSRGARRRSRARCCDMSSSRRRFCSPRWASRSQ